MVVVTVLGSSVEPMGAGSTYLRTVWSAGAKVSRVLVNPLRDRSRYLLLCLSRVTGAKHTLLLVHLHRAVKVHTRNDDVGEHVDGAHNIQHIGIVKRHLLASLHHKPAISAISILYPYNNLCEYVLDWDWETRHPLTG